LKTFLVVVLLLAAAIVLLLYLKKQGLLEGKGTGPWPFYVKKPLTQPEQVLYHRLVKALPDHIVLAQVQVSRVLGVKKGSSFNEGGNGGQVFPFAPTEKRDQARFGPMSSDTHEIQ
jgi:hypothetical protein